VSAGGLQVASLRRFAPWNDGKPGAFVFSDLLKKIEVSGEALPEEAFRHGGPQEATPPAGAPSPARPGY